MDDRDFNHSDPEFGRGPLLPRRGVRDSLYQKPQTKVCYFYKDADVNFGGIRIAINPKRYRSVETLKKELTGKVKGLPFGVRSIYTPGGHDQVDSVEALQDNGRYVCSTHRAYAHGVDIARVHGRRVWRTGRPPSGRKQHLASLAEGGGDSLPPPAHPRKAWKPKGNSQFGAIPSMRTPKKIQVILNGDPHQKHILLLNRRTTQNFEQVLKDLGQMFQIRASKLYTLEGRPVRSLSSIFNGPDMYALSRGEPFKSLGALTDPTPFSESVSPLRGRRRLKPDVVAQRLRDKRDKLARTRGKWKVWVSTGNLPSAGTNANVSLTVYGHKGNSGPIPLGYGDGSTFQSGNIDEFEVAVGNIGEIFKVRISHDNTQEFPGWLLDEVRMQDVHTDEQLTFKCGRWLDRDQDDHEICRELPAIRRGESAFPVVEYNVQVETGEVWNGGTDANVYVTLYGDRGDTGVRQLLHSNRPDKFKKGNTDTFSLEAVSLGNLKRVIIGHDGTGSGAGWFLEKITVKEKSKNGEWAFPCSRWLDEGEDDGKIVRELKPQDEYRQDFIEKQMWEYEKWKFDNHNQVLLYSRLTQLPLRIKQDASLDASGDYKDQMAVFNVLGQRGMLRVFQSAINPKFHLAIDNAKVMGHGRGGAYCEFKVHVQVDRSVLLESNKYSLQHINATQNGKPGDPRGALDDPSKQFFVYCKGVFRDQGVIVLCTSLRQTLNIDHDNSLYGTGKRNKLSHFLVHKVGTGGVRMFESVVFPKQFIQLKDSKFDVMGKGDSHCHFKVRKVRDKAYVSLESLHQKGICLGLMADGSVRPTVDTGEKNTRFYPEVIQWGIPKKREKFFSTELAPSPPPVDMKPKKARNKKPVKTIASPTPTPTQKAEPEEPKPAAGEWNVTVLSDEDAEHADVVLVVYGDAGHSGDILLGRAGTAGMFQAGNQDEFKVNLSKVGQLYKLRVELRPLKDKKPAKWKIREIKLKDLNTKEVLRFKFNRWLSRSHGDKDLMCELPAIRPAQEVLPVFDYEVQTYTANVPGADTDAHVYITLFGERGDSGKRLLFQSNHRNKFQEGQVDVFCISAVSLASVQRVLLSHDGDGPGAGWLCEKVIVKESKDSNNTYLFPCNKWMDSSIDDGKLERLLKIGVEEPPPVKKSPSPKPPTPKARTPTPVVRSPTPQEQAREPTPKPPTPKPPPPQAGEFTVWVTTGKEAAMATRNQVLLVAYGDKDVSREVELGEGLESFRAGHTHEVKVNFSCDLGELYKVRIGHREDADSEGWFLEKLKLKDEHTEQLYMFKVNRWMSRSEEDLDVWRELPVVLPGKNPLPVVIYTIEIQTGSRPGADTEADIYVKLIGRHGDSGKRLLFKSQNNSTKFQSGQLDIFKLEAVTLDEITQVWLGHSEKGKGAGWYCDHVTVREGPHPEAEVYHFPCYQWLDQGMEDRKTERMLERGEPPKESRGQYVVHVKTASDSKAPHNSTAFITLYGSKSQSRDLPLTSSHEAFLPGSVEEFKVDVGELGDLYKIRISRDYGDNWEGWHLEEVRLVDQDTRKEFVFACGRWLDLYDGDHHIVREMPVVMETDPLPVEVYEVLVYTGDRWAAGTDADVYLTLYGTRGDTGRRYLTHAEGSEEKFRRDQVDTFLVEAVSLDKLERAVIGHTGQGHGAGWHLDRLVVRVKGKGEKEWVFGCGRWLDDHEEDRKTERELLLTAEQEINHKPATAKEDSHTQGKYEIRVTTSDLQNAATHAQVSLTVYGQKGNSGKLALGSSGAEASHWERGAVFTDTISVGDIGDLTKIRIEHDNTHSFPAWHLRLVELEDQDTGAQFVFPVNRWLADSEEDGSLCRELPVTRTGVDSKPVLRYYLGVYTGDVSNAETNANVSVCLFGDHGDSGVRSLSDSLIHQVKFLPGQIDVFTIECVSLGNLESVQVMHDGKDTDSAWFLDKLIVKEGLWSVSQWTFPCMEWVEVEPGSESAEVKLTTKGTELYTPLPSHELSLLRSEGQSESGSDWTVWTYTGHHAGPPTNTKVSVVLCGTVATSESVRLENEGECFKPGKEDKFQISVGFIGELLKVRLSLDPLTPNPSLQLDKMKLKNVKSGQEFYMEYGKMLKKEKGGSQIVVELPAIRPDIAPLAEKTYLLSVTTGKEVKGDTEATVYCDLIGPYGDAGKRKLVKPISQHAKLFQRGQTDQFEIRCLDLGTVNTIVIGHDRLGRGKGWFCEQVVLSDTSSPEKTQTVFPCHQWLDTGIGDRRIERMLKPMLELPVPTESDPSKLPKSNGMYKAFVSSAAADNPNPNSGENANTNNNISSSDNNETSDTATTQSNDEELDGDTSDSEEGFRCICGQVWMDCDCDVLVGSRELVQNGDTSVTWSDDSAVGACPTYNCDLLLEGSEFTQNDCHQGVTVEKEEDRVRTKTKDWNKQLNQKIYVTRDICIEEKKWRESRICDCGNELSGNSGASEFSQSRSLVVLPSLDYGTGLLMNKRRDIGDVHSLDGKQAQVMFKSGCDFSSNSGAVESTPKGSNYLSQLNCNNSAGDSTQDMEGIGAVSVMVYGDNGVAGPIELNNGDPDMFSPGKQDEFDLHVGDLGQLYKIRVTNALGRPWCLQQIMLQDVTTKEKLMFNFSPYVGESGGDIRKELPVVRPGSVVLPVLQYRVTIVTQDKEAQQEKAPDLFVRLFGERGDSGSRHLNAIDKDGADKLVTPGGQHTFIISAVDLLTVNKVVLTKGRGAPVHIQQVCVKKAEFAPVEWCFPYNQTISDNESAVKKEVELVAVETLKCPTAIALDECPHLPKSEGVWQVWTTTGSEGNCGTDRQVQVVLCGEEGESPPISLIPFDTDKPALQPGNTDFFMIQLREPVGEIQKIRLGFEDTTNPASWYCDRIRFEDEATKDEFVIETQAWVTVDAESDGWREFAVSWPGVEPIPMVQHEVEVHTGDRVGAGTQASIYMTLYGNLGNSGERRLKKPMDGGAVFDQGSVNRFLVEAAHLGVLQMIVVRHDGNGAGEGWFLDFVTVKVDGVPVRFECDQWLDTGKEDGKIERTLLVSKKDRVEGEPWAVKFNTGSDQAEEITRPVTIVICGDTGQKELTLNEDQSAVISAGKENVFNVKFSQDLGEVYKIRVGFCDNKDIAWQLTKITLERFKTGEEFVFVYGDFVLVDSEHDGWTEIPRFDEDPAKMRQVHSYQVKIHTKDVHNAGTDANVYLQLFGSHGDTGKRQLKYSSLHGTNKFEQDSVDLFSIQAVDLGDITSLTIGHDGEGFGSGWYLDDISVRESEQAEQTAYFKCDRWLDKGEDDRLIERELQAQLISPAPVEEPKTGVTWSVVVRNGPYSPDTEERTDTPTPPSGNALLVLYGENGRSEPQTLNSANPTRFLPNQTEQYEITVDEDLGDLYKVRVGFTEEVSELNWPLEYILLQKEGADEQMRFEHSGYVIRDEKQDGWTEIPKQKETDPEQICTYQVEAFTSDITAAGTDANVFVEIHGSHGDTGPRQLKKSQNEARFEQNQMDSFEIRAVHLGDLTKVLVWHDGKGLGSGWHLGKIVIVNSAQRDNLHIFQCDRWLDEGEDDGLTKRELKLSSTEERQATPVEEGDPWKVIVRSGIPADGAASQYHMTSQLTITLCGSGGTSEAVPLRSFSTDLYQAGQTDEFNIRVKESVGQLYKIRLAFDQAHDDQAWLPASVSLQEIESGTQYECESGRWMVRSDKQDGIQEIACQSEGSTALPVIFYQLQVYTADVTGAGTDAQVSVLLTGKNGDTGERLLLHSATHNSKFEQNQMDIFDLEAVHLGKLSTLKVRHNGSGAGSGWFLDQIVVKSRKPEVEYVFPCHRWLDEGEDDGQIERTLSVLPQPGIPWLITTVTSTEAGAGTQGPAALVLYTNCGKSKPVIFGDEPNTIFDDGQLQNFPVHIEFEDSAIKSEDIKEVYKVRLILDPTQERTQDLYWFLDQLHLKDQTNSQEFAFELNDRVNANDRCDGQVEIPLKKSDNMLQVFDYQVEVFTKDVSNAGTDANVHLMLCGSRGDTGVRKMLYSQTEGNKFESGMRDVFIVPAVDLDDLSKVVVGHDGKGVGSGWYLDRIVVKEGVNGKRKCHFPCDKWLDEGEDDGQIERTLSVLPQPGIPWLITTVTSTEAGAGTQGPAALVLYTNCGKSKPVIFGDEPNTIFDDGQLQNFPVHIEFEDSAIKSEDIKEVYKVRLILDPTQERTQDLYWFLDRLHLKDQTNSQEFSFELNDRVNANDRCDGQVEIPLKKSDNMLQVFDYQVEVYTKDVSNAGTDANVHLMLCGSRGDTGVRKMLYSQTEGNKFESGKGDVFIVPAVDLDDVSQVVVGHDGKGVGSGWYLDKIVVREGVNGKREFHFPCDKWLDEGEDDGQIERTLSVLPQPGIPWLITTVTSTEAGAGTQGPAALVLYTNCGKSKQVIFGDEPNTIFDDGQLQNFPVHIEFEDSAIKSEDIKEVYKVRLILDPTQERTQDLYWFLDRLHLKDQTNSQEFAFELNDRVNANDRCDGQVEIPLKKSDNMLQVFDYQVEVFTKDVSNAGTDANVHLMLCGRHGDSGIRKMLYSQTEGNKFESGMRDVFSVPAVDLDDLSQVVVGHDGKGVGSGWYLDRIVVKEGVNAKREFHFPCDKWLDEDSEDHLVERTLSLTQPEGEAWCMTLVTSESGGTDGPVQVEVFGESGGCKPLTVGENAEFASTQNFPVWLSCTDDKAVADQGDMYKIRIRLDPHSKVDKDMYWELEKVKLENLGSGQVHEFVCKSRIEKNKDSEGVVELAVTKEEDPPKVHNYYVEVYTKDESGAGTDASVHLTITGSKGNTGRRKLLKSHVDDDKFERGKMDAFVVPAVDLGTLTSLCIGHDGSGFGSSWYLDRVVVKQDVTSAVNFVFDCDKVLDDDNKEVELPLTMSLDDPESTASEGTDDLQTEGDWRVLVTTSSEEEAGTSGQVTLTVVGAKGETGPLPLGDPEKGLFQPGQTDEFDVYIEPEDVGDLQRLKLTVGEGQSWKPEKLVLVNTVTERVLEVPVDKAIQDTEEFPIPTESQDPEAEQSTQ